MTLNFRHVFYSLYSVKLCVLLMGPLNILKVCALYFPPPREDLRRPPLLTRRTATVPSGSLGSEAVHSHHPRPCSRHGVQTATLTGPAAPACPRRGKVMHSSVSRAHGSSPTTRSHPSSPAPHAPLCCPLGLRMATSPPAWPPPSAFPCQVHSLHDL